jgi:hypothetical protein
MREKAGKAEVGMARIVRGVESRTPNLGRNKITGIPVDAEIAKEHSVVVGRASAKKRIEHLRPHLSPSGAGLVIND